MVDLRQQRQHVRVAIIGSGFGGLGMAMRLQQAGMRDFLLFERAGDVGGTWRDNDYPGAACDVPSHLYSFAFALNPDWTSSFSRPSRRSSTTCGAAPRSPASQTGSGSAPR